MQPRPSRDLPTFQNERYIESPFNIYPTLRLESRTKSVETLEIDVPPVALDHVAENGCVIPHLFRNERPGTADSLCAATGCAEDIETEPGVSSLTSRVRSLSSLPSPFTENTRCQPGCPMPFNSINAPVTPELSPHVTYDCTQQRFFIPSHSRASSVDSDASLDLAWGTANPRTRFDSPTSGRLHYRVTSWTEDSYQPLLTAMQPRLNDDAPRHLRLVASAEALLAPHRPQRAANRPRAGSYVGTSAISAGPSLTPSPLRPVHDHPTSVDLSPSPAQGHLNEVNHLNSPSSARKKSIKVLWTTGGPILLPTDRTKPTHVRGLSGCFSPVPHSPPTRPLPPVPRHSIEPSRSFGNLVNGHAATPVKVEAAQPGDDYPLSPQLWSRDVSLQSLSDHLTVRVPGRLPNPSTADKENQRTLTLSTTARALHSLRQLASKARNKRPTALDVFATGNDEVSLLQDA